MKKLAILCVCALTLGMTGCSLKPAPQVDVTVPEEEQTATENTETTETEAEVSEPEAEAEATDYSQYARLDEGWHSTGTLTEEIYDDYCYIKSLEFVEGGLLIEASFYRYENDDWDNPILFDMDTYFVPIDENTQYQSSGGMDDPHPIAAEEFPQYLQNCLGSGLGVGIEIENGVAKTFDIFS